MREFAYNLLAWSQRDLLLDEGPVHLGDHAPLRAGRLRLVYDFPGDASRLIKVFRQDIRQRGLSHHMTSLQGIRRLYKHTIPLFRELRAWRRTKPRDERHMQAIHGLVQTDLGLGMVVEAIRQPNGDLAPTLQDLILKGRYDQDTERMVEAFAEWFLASHVVAADLHARNLVLDEARKSLVLVDGSGDKTFLPLRSWFRVLNSRSKRSYIDELLNEIASMRGHLKSRSWTPQP